MVIKELFNDARPALLLAPGAAQRLDPRFKFTRNSLGSYLGADGIVKIVPGNVARFDHDPTTKESLGLLVEEGSTNLIPRSEELSVGWTISNATATDNSTLSPENEINGAKLAENSDLSVHRAYRRINGLTGEVTYTTSAYFKANGRSTMRFSIDYAYTSAKYMDIDLSTGTYTEYGSPIAASLVYYGNGWYRAAITATNSGPGGFIDINLSLTDSSFNQTYQGNGTSGIYIWGVQLEASSHPTSYIPTNGSTCCRAADLLSIEGTSLPSTGSIYIDARSLTSDVDDTLLSAANASDDKLTLAIRQPASLYNSKALVYEVDGAFKPTLPFPVPSNEQERNLITYGANNYHYRSDSARYTPSSSTSVPAGMNRLGIGHDVTDPTKAISGYINTVYLWPGEITPTVAEALVRGDVDPKDADAGVFTPEAGALAFVFNTQGTGTSGDRVVQLPFGGSTNNILVDWGDNTSSSFIGAAASSTVSHTYPSAGIYPVQITADDDGTNSGLQTLTFYNSSQRLDLVRVLQWGGSTTWQPTTMYRAFRDCTQLDFENAARTNLPDTSAITDWREAFYNCSSISGTFPTFNTSAATTFQATWGYCSSMTSFPFINSSNVTNMQQAWRNCASLTSFPEIDTSKVTNMSLAWYSCSSLASFPRLDTGAVTSMSDAWYNCQFTSFPALDTSSVTSMTNTWSSCGELTSFPIIDTSSVTNMSGAWFRCRKMTSFPALNTSSVTNMQNTWNECETLASMPLIDTSNVTNFSGTWFECFALTSFPAIDTSSGTAFNATWKSCTGLTSFPRLDTSGASNFIETWYACLNLTSFPAIDTSSGTNFTSTWRDCQSLTSFPALDFSSGTFFYRAWRDCSSLTDFPPGVFSSWTGTPADDCFVQTWDGCTSLTATSVENILNSIDTSGQSAPASGKDITIDYNAGSGTPSISTAVTNLKGRGWTITLNGVAQ